MALSKRLVVPMSMLLAASAVAATAGYAPAKSTPTVNITLAGPNQWTDSGHSYGPGWPELVKGFEKANPGVKLNILVLPLTSFGSWETLRIATGDAPNIMFDQFTYHPYQVVSLNKWLKAKNPYDPASFPTWDSSFDSHVYNFAQNAVSGQMYVLPINEVNTGIYYNVTAFKKAGITSIPTTWPVFMTDLGKLKKAGYTPFAATNSDLTPDWTFGTILNMLLASDYQAWNKYTPLGKPGKSPTLTTEDLARVIKLGLIRGSSPSVVETLKLMKQFEAYWTTDWTGIVGNSGAVSGLRQFVSGKAAMAWGVNFGLSAIKSAHPNFQVKTMPFPTITKATTPLSINLPAQQNGASIGGTTYVIPSSTKGQQLKYAVRFLQYATSPKANQAWIDQTGGSSVINGVKSAPGLQGFEKGAWASPEETSASSFSGGLSPQAGTEFLQNIQGYLLGSVSLSQMESDLEQNWEQGADYQIQQSKSPHWTYSWTKLGNTPPSN